MSIGSNQVVPRPVASGMLMLVGAVVAVARWMRGDRAGSGRVWRRSKASARLVWHGDSAGVVVNTIRHID